MKSVINKIVNTPKGIGTIVDIEEFRTAKRYGVKLDKNPFDFHVAYFFKEECKEISEVCTCENPEKGYKRNDCPIHNWDYDNSLFEK